MCRIWLDFSAALMIFLATPLQTLAENVVLKTIPQSTVQERESNTTTTFLTVCVTLEDDSYYIPTYNRVAATVDLAITNANNYILPDSVRFRTVFQSAGPSCSQIQHSAPTNFLHLMRAGVTCDTIVGIGCASSAVALYCVAEEYNIPMFACPGAGASSLALNGTRNRFPLLLRTSYGHSNLARAFSTFFSENNYSHISVFRDDSYTFHSLTSKYLMNYFRSNNPKIFRNSAEIPFFGKSITVDGIRALLEGAKNRSRVIVVLTHALIVRQFMLNGRNMGMTEGEYLFMAVELHELAYWGRISYLQYDKDDGNAREAFQSLFVMSLSEIAVNSLDEYLAVMIKRNAKAKYNYSYQALEKPDPNVMGFYESIMIYAQEVTWMLAAGLNFRNGTAMVSRIINSTYVGITGSPLHIGQTDAIGSHAERQRDIDLKTFDKTAGEYKLAIRFVASTTNQTVIQVDDTLWFSNHGMMPPDKPRCGFQNDECKTDERLPPGMVAAVIVIPLLAVVAVTAAAAYAVFKLRSLQKDYNPDWWKIYLDDLTIKQNRTTSSNGSKKTLTSQSTAGASALSGFSAYNCDILASYKGSLVALTDVGALGKTPTSDMVSKLNLLKNASHSNLQRFIGIGLSTQGICQYVVTEICAKGSLLDILSFSTMKLDWSFKNSLIKDVVFGMSFIHTSPIISHGNLNGHVCLIDTRFTLKISDYGLPFFRNAAYLMPYRPHDHPDQSVELLLWRAPELLRQSMPPQGTQKGDVYSFAIIIQQIILRSGPFELPNDPLEMSEREILNEVVASNIPPVRPRVPRAACSNELYDLMERCWEEIPVERPTFPKIKERLKKVIGDYGDNIVDVLFKRMEQYAMDLELKVAEKTQQFMDEKNRSEQLLSQLLPTSVAAALTRGEHVDPEAYESVSIYFSDIVGFTTIAAAGSPMEVVNILNGLYTFFDGVIEKFDVYKVETIGDAYMVSSGLPVRNGNRHAAEISSMSIELMKGIRSFNIPGRPGQDIQVRIGLNSGPCVAGIVGLKMPRYCLFGDTVNVASRMESTGEAMKIQITQTTKDLLMNIGGYRTTERGPVAVKGKGMLITHWLLGAD
ncbi:Atrial natriuretic peptide receptor 1 [Hypsibius exemplaris]|uniref:Guanylate cyclase n=1 Tax=Hypsibius exemplaris TaxID=2072580 RepID=A0A1W0X6Z6_HYPEX|nr:Atrial natriuretic peptide receptor 1 [Hypsibius exemplaris]